MKGHKMYSDKVNKYNFEVGVYRPPSEGGSYSLLIRVSRNCPWNKCEFCSMYKTEKFQRRSSEEVKRDIDAIAAIRDDLKRLSLELGYKGEINRNVALALMQKEPMLGNSHEFAMVFNWLVSGGKTAFLQDANSLFVKTETLVDILKHLRQTFPSLERVTSYARSKTLARKSLDELTQIRQAGLDRVHVGLETGDDVLLKKINKGVTSEEHIVGGQKAMQAGFQLSEYWMTGLGGQDLWEAHARNTARVLNEINPDYIRSRPFFPIAGSSMHEAYEAGEFEMLTPRGQLIELKLFIEGLDFDAKVCFDHAGNYWRSAGDGLLFNHGYEGYQFPQKKAWVLQRIEDGIQVQEDDPTAPYLMQL